MNQIDKNIKKFKAMTRIIFIISIGLILILIWFFSRAFFVINVNPANAIVTVDNFPLQMNRYGKGSILSKPGNHTVRVEADGYIGTTREMNFKRGLTTRLSVTLKEMPKQELIEKEGKFLSQGRNSNEFIYLSQDGLSLIKAYITVNNEGNLSIEKQAITDKRLSGISQIIWSPNRDLALFRVRSEIHLFDFQKYDFINQTESLFGQNIGEVAWSPDNSKIAYFYAPATGERSLVFSNLNNSETTRFLNLNDENLTIENPKLRWSPDSRYLLLIPQSKDYDQNKIYLLDTYQRTIKALTDMGDQIDAMFSPNGDKILYSTYLNDPANHLPFVLSVMDADGSNQKSLNIRGDLNKVVWKNDSENILLSDTNQEKNLDYISIYSTKMAQKNTDFLLLPAGQKVNLLQISTDDKIVVYQTDAGIYASRLEE